MEKECERMDFQRIWKEVQRGKDYNDSIDLYETVKTNEAFFIGDQWRNLKGRTPDLLLVTLNFLQRVVNMFVAKVGSEDFGANFVAFDDTDDSALKMRMIADQVDQAIELMDLRRLNKTHVRDCAVDGDTCCYMWWDADAPTGQKAKGAIRCENIENMNVLFGNPYDSRVERQPYIILLQRKHFKEVQAEAEQNGVPVEQWQSIRPDTEVHLEEEGNHNMLCTVAVRLWMDKEGHVWCCKSTADSMVREPWDTGLSRYPIAWMGWDKVRNSYHGRSCITGLIPNQVALNTNYSSIMTQIRNTAFAKLIYSDVVGKWNPSPAAAIKVNGAIDVSKTATYLQGASVNPSITNVMDSLVSMTRDFMGTSDATMGNVNPTNASAIIAIQNADAVPMELHRQEYYSFVEQQVRIIVDMMHAYYGKREVVQLMMPPGGGSPINVRTEFDFSTLTNENYKIRVDVGSASYWNETLQVETLNNIFTSGIMQDPEAFALFLEVMPEKYVPRRQKLLDYAKKKQSEMQAAQEQSPQVDIGPSYQGNMRFRGAGYTPDERQYVKNAR